MLFAFHLYRGSAGIDVKQAVGTSSHGLNRLGDLLWRRKPGYTAVDVSLLLNYTI
jgi:hypothetical protein